MRTSYLRSNAILGFIVLLLIGEVNANEAMSTSYSPAPKKLCTGEVVGIPPTPDISVTQSVTAFRYCAGFASPAQSFTVSGTALIAEIGIKAPTDFEISTDGSSYSDTITLTPASGSVASTTIYVRVSDTASGPVSGNVNITSTGADPETVAVSPSQATAASVSIGSSDGDNSICSGTSVTFTATPTDGGTPTYQWKLNGNNVGSNSATYTTSSLVNGDQVKVEMTSSITCLSPYIVESNTITTSVTTTVTPSVSIASSDADNSICNGTSVTFTATPTDGGTPTYQWKLNGNNMGTNSSTYTTSSLANGDAVNVVMTSSLTCVTASSSDTSNTITTAVTTIVTPSVSIVSSDADSSICSGTSVTFTATPTNGGASPAYQWKRNNVDIAGATGSTYVTDTLNNNDAIKVVMTSSLECVTSATATSNILPTTVTGTSGSRIWTGNTSTDWFTGSNWCTGVVPSSTNSIVIPQVLTNYPVLTNNVTVADLTIVGNATLSLNGNELTLTGTVSGAGQFVGSLTSSLVFTGTASMGTIRFSGARPDTSNALASLTYNRAGQTLTLGNTLNIYGVVTPTNGTFSTAGFLVLKSNANGTARVAAGTYPYIAGEVTVERYIPNTGRRYRLLAPMVNSTFSIFTNWMESGLNTSISNSNPNPGYGTHITGVSENVNGFDYSISNQASMFTVTNGASLTYNPVLSTLINNLYAKKGYFLFVRGSRNIQLNLANTNVPPNPLPLPSDSTILRAKGELLTGEVSFSGTEFVSIANAKNLVTNPYASPIVWDSVYAASINIKNNYTLWDPSIGYRGGFVTVTNGVASAGSATKIIQPGQAFFVEALTSYSVSGLPVVVVVKESHKTLGNNNGVFAPVSLPAASLRASIYYNEATGYRRLADGAISQMDNGYTTALDENDAVEIANWDENLAIAQGGKQLAIEQRKKPVAGDTLSLYISNMKIMNYELQLNLSGLTDAALQAYLVDRFTGTQTLIKNDEATVLPFSVTSNTATSASTRFYVVFKAASTLPVRIVQFKASAKDKGVQVNWQVEEDESVERYEVQHSKDQQTFKTINTQLASGLNKGTVNYRHFDGEPVKGNNFYRLKVTDKSGEVTYSRVERVTFSGSPRSMQVFPNPLTGTELQVKLEQWPAGDYRLRITDVLGRVVYQQQFEIREGNMTLPVRLSSTIKAAGGVFWLKLEGEGIEEVRKVVRM